MRALRSFVWTLVLCVAVVGPVTAQRGPRTITLRSTPPTPEQTVRGSARGDTDGPDCIGYFTDAPQLVIRATNEVGWTRLVVAADVDTVMLLKKPDGTVLCTDDVRSNGQLSANPLIQTSFETGTHRVWIGTRARGVTAHYVLAVGVDPRVVGAALTGAPPEPDRIGIPGSPRSPAGAPCDRLVPCCRAMAAATRLPDAEAMMCARLAGIPPLEESVCAQLLESWRSVQTGFGRTPPPECDAPQPPLEFRVSLTDRRGGGMPSVGTVCSLSVTVSPGSGAPDGCVARLECGGELIYGGPRAGAFPCRDLSSGGAPALVGGEDSTSVESSDPAFRIDSRTGRVEVRDDASGARGEFALRGRILR